MKKLLLSLLTLLFCSSWASVQAVTYTPAGTPASVFGTEWAPTLTANDMVLSNGLYVFAKKDNFSQTSISFKVCKDHAWTTSYPGSNYSFTIPNGSKYLIITYNTSGNAVNALAISSMTVAGEPASVFGETWNTGLTANDMTLQSDGTYKFEKTGVALSAGTVSFKACANHAWTNAWPSSDYSLSIPESGEYTITITFDPKTLSVSATADLEYEVEVIPTIQLHSNITNPSWASSAEFDVAANSETASLTLSNVTKGDYEFGVKVDGSWTSNGSAFTRANPSHAVTSGSGNCTFNADRNGDYTFTWTYATNTLAVTYPAIPAQSVELTGLSSQILKGTVVNFTATSSGIDDPGYRYYVKEKGGSYGSAVTSYTFNTIGEYVVKVEALEDNTGDPVADDESEVLVYDQHTFASGTTIFVDFTAMTEGDKGVNYPKVSAMDIDYDANGAGTFKAVTFTTDVTWSTLATAFIKTGKAGWAALKFSVPGTGQNCVKVAADGASYTWDTYVDLTTNFYLAGSFNNWTPTADHRFMKENEDDTEATVTIDIEEYSNITFKVMEGAAYCGSSDAITKDANTATIAAAGEGNNIAMTPYAAGDYIFTLDLSTRELTVTYPDGEQMPIPTNIYLASEELNDWNYNSNDYKFAVSGDIATLEIDLTAETTYEFKLVYNDAWLGANYDFKYYWCTDVPMRIDELSSAHLYTFKAGAYTFRYKISTGEMSIVYPATSATVVAISEYEYATLYSTTAFDVPADVEAYIITGSEGIKLTMERIYRIPANTGVLLHAAQGNYNFYEGDGRYMDAISTNYLKGSTTDETINNDLVHYVLSYDEAGKVGLFWPYGTGAAQGVGSFENKAGKAYLEMPTQSAGVAARRGYRLTEQTEVYTSIENTDLQQQGGKYIHRGQLLIIHDGKIYNAQGARVQ